MTIKLRGDHTTGEVWLNGEFLDIRESQVHHNHSPTGFGWGYAGSGESQLALAICLRIYPEHKALYEYMVFKAWHIVTLPQKSFDMELTV